MRKAGFCMNFFDLVAKRRSVRSFSDRTVSKEEIEKCIDAAHLAPSACNSQPWKFVAVCNDEKRGALAQAACKGIYTEKLGPNRLLFEAPVIVALVNEKMKLAARSGAVLKGTDYSLIDIGIAGEHFVLAASALGIGTCWVGWFNEKEVKKVLNIPRKLRVPALIAMGYAKEKNFPEKKRKDKNQIMSFDEY